MQSKHHKNCKNSNFLVGSGTKEQKKKTLSPPLRGSAGKADIPEKSNSLQDTQQASVGVHLRPNPKPGLLGTSDGPFSDTIVLQHPCPQAVSRLQPPLHTDNRSPQLSPWQPSWTSPSSSDPRVQLCTACLSPWEYSLSCSSQHGRCRPEPLYTLPQLSLL